MSLTREQMREYQRKKRAEKKGLQASCKPDVNQPVNPCKPVNWEAEARQLR